MTVHIIKTARDNLLKNKQVVSCCLQKETLNVSKEAQGKRLDVYLSESLSMSRSFIQKIIKDGAVKWQDKAKVKAARVLKGGECIEITIPEPQSTDLIPEPVDFEVVYEDDQMIVIDKPAGVVVHPAPGHWNGTLVHGLLYRYPDIGNINNVIRPGIVHRLDSTTSGLMVIARTTEAMLSLQRSFKERRVKKLYLALAEGRALPDKVRIDAPIGRDRNNRYRMSVTDDGKPSITDFNVLWRNGQFTFVSCQLHTGRTHQIRVHLRDYGCPLVGDDLYGFKNSCKSLLKGRVFLHSWRLTVPHPATGADMTFKSYLPVELLSVLQEVISRVQR